MVQSESLSMNGPGRGRGREMPQQEAGRDLKIILYIPITVRIVAGSDLLTIQFFSFPKRANKAKESSLRPENSRFPMLKTVVHTTPYGSPLHTISEHRQQGARG